MSIYKMAVRLICLSIIQKRINSMFFLKMFIYFKSFDLPSPSFYNSYYEKYNKFGFLLSLFVIFTPNSVGSLIHQLKKSFFFLHITIYCCAKTF